MVSSIKTITNSMVKNILFYKDLIPAIESGLADFSSGQVIQPVRTTVHLEAHNGYHMTMSAYNTKQDVLAMKNISLYPSNPEKNLPSHQCQILYFKASTGALLALIDADVVTEMRTAAASAVATNYLANKNPKVLAVLGAGNQAYSHIHALSHSHTYDQILIWNRTIEKGRKLCEKVSALAGAVTVCDTVEEAVANADVIVTATTSPTPVLHGANLKDGVHINCVGAVRPNWRELDDDCIDMCDLYVDSRSAALVESGDIILSKKEICGEIGEVVDGSIKANRSRRTIFKSSGIAVEDAVTADLVWKQSQKYEEN